VFAIAMLTVDWLYRKQSGLVVLQDSMQAALKHCTIKAMS